MNKEEVLARSRSEKSDEGFREAENRGRKIGVSAFCAMVIAIVLFNLFTGQSSAAPLALFWAFAAAEAYPKYRFTNRRVYLTTTVLGSIVALLYLASHILTVMR